MSYFVPSKYIRQNGIWFFDSFVKNAYFNMDDAQIIVWRILLKMSIMYLK